MFTKIEYDKNNSINQITLEKCSMFKTDLILTKNTLLIMYTMYALWLSFCILYGFLIAQNFTLSIGLIVFQSVLFIMSKCKINIYSKTNIPKFILLHLICFAIMIPFVLLVF